MVIDKHTGARPGCGGILVILVFLVLIVYLAFLENLGNKTKSPAGLDGQRGFVIYV